MVEAADALDPGLEPRGADAAQRIGQVLGDMAIDLADEAQGEVELLVVLPAEVRTVVHRVDQQVADRLGRADGDEQAVHAASDSALRPERNPRGRAAAAGRGDR